MASVPSDHTQFSYTVNQAWFHRKRTFVAVLYDRVTVSDSVNKVRKHLFAQKSRDIENIPPTSDALEEHVKRAVYQAGYVWRQLLVCWQELPSPASWGWQRKGDSWTPIWMKLPVVQEACAELVCCHCKISCKGNCKCHKANLPCTSLCGCDGQCFQAAWTYNSGHQVIHIESIIVTAKQFGTLQKHFFNLQLTNWVEAILESKMADTDSVVNGFIESADP